MSEEALQKCLKLLKGTTDEEKFVGLVLAPKVLKASNLQHVLMVFDAVGLEFIDRLLITQGKQMKKKVDAQKQKKG
jgi:hypothetical protein